MDREPVSVSERAVGICFRAGMIGGAGSAIYSGHSFGIRAGSLIEFQDTLCTIKGGTFLFFMPYTFGLGALLSGGVCMGVVTPYLYVENFLLSTIGSETKNWDYQY